jgi:hypothetical protein
MSLAPNQADPIINLPLYSYLIYDLRDFIGVASPVVGLRLRWLGRGSLGEIEGESWFSEILGGLKVRPLVDLECIFMHFFMLVWLGFGCGGYSDVML